MSERISPVTGLPVRRYVRNTSYDKEEIREEVIVKEIPKHILKNEDFKFYRNIGSDTYDFKFAIVDRGVYDTTSLYFSYGPTVNCQMSIIGAFGEFIKKETHIIEQLKAIKKFCKKNILLVDIKECNMKYFNEKIPEHMVIMKSPYVSTNGSKMNICLINIKSL